MPLTGREKATIFLSILGAEASSRVLRYLPDELADLIAAGINHLPAPSPDALAEVLNEFKSHLALADKPAVPRIEGKPVPPPQPKKNYAILMYERPQTVAFLLSLMPKEQRQDVLMALPREKAVIEEMLNNLRPNHLAIKIGAKLKNQFGEKLF
ncbi:hypothetical protein A2291_07180 [candidate division WOR-1 bacterium RIFOXYB2_FULL_42_35]|uniref:Flagellar motor switch protein FliG N-terminal domain-containing protein n=1 Tax=candidate division WOR-1 bacterium RIFOXYC2_FULL_41_25 TaxID=1802586 RepID=A0A1F4TKK3_UNCSA|nr:MAG: hypothetical protein A2247_04520 [candidate division WOR-1 bacterium RIFOXYA2_FULL_41_14]OGC22488.1 MAG: hypothetical protein A2291_07180 [candidate division WOR-1 bacterium RIFOXYB2_FULL_42_35]OGC33226.1 MAG: hypothetical protein A2462_07355 [candidate division WOR-1 bacterium RIFOXYC2_FULL_41_25]OGC43489.1 MAG: hypothetical protein A2548_00870 [candidate division WOR-1 bacterium RIFOXYD2_FULL_41_8]